MKKIQHLIEAFSLKIFFILFRALPLDMASAAGGFLARIIGPFLSAHNTARNNLAMIFPEKSEAERKAILSDMWDSLGRNMGELPHLPGKELIKRGTIIGAEHLPTAGEPVLFFSGHLGNWELLPSVPNYKTGGITLIYRHANNPYVDDMIAKLRATHSSGMLAKGPRGAFKLAKSIKRKESLFMLVDQKMNDGISVPFFGREAMTAPAIAQLSLRYGLPIIPARVVRKQGAHFETIIYPRLDYTPTGDKEKDILDLMKRINGMLEGWIREHPEQWFWVHKRWPKDAL